LLLTYTKAASRCCKPAGKCIFPAKNQNSMNLLTEQIHGRSYRLPPVRIGQYMIFRRGKLKFSARSWEISTVINMERVINPRRYSSHEQGREQEHKHLSWNDPLSDENEEKIIVDLNDGLEAKNSAMPICSALVVFRTQPVVYMAVDEVVSLKEKGSERICCAAHPRDKYVVFKGMTLTLLNAANIISRSREKNRDWPGEFIVLENTGAIGGRGDEEVKQSAAEARRMEWADRIEKQIVYPLRYRQKSKK